MTCVQNLIKWTGISIPEALETVTSTPAKMLGVDDRKGTLNPGADADLVVLNEITNDQGLLLSLEVEEVWKFGVQVHRKERLQESAKEKYHSLVMARL